MKHVNERFDKLVDETQAAFDGTADAIKGYVDRSIDGVFEIINELKSCTFKDEGVWRDDTTYHKNGGRTFDGSFWIAQRATQPGEKPGASDGFRLAVKRGRDGR